MFAGATMEDDAVAVEGIELGLEHGELIGVGCWQGLSGLSGLVPSRIGERESSNSRGPRRRTSHEQVLKGSVCR